MKRLFTALIAIALSLQSFACGCDGTVGFEEADLVFIGKVIKIEDLPPHAAPYCSNVTFIVEEVQKDPNKLRAPKIIINTNVVPKDRCGIYFQLGKKYKVLVLKVNGILMASYCSETHLIKNSADN